MPLVAPPEPTNAIRGRDKGSSLSPADRPCLGRDGIASLFQPFKASGAGADLPANHPSVELGEVATYPNGLRGTRPATQEGAEAGSSFVDFAEALAEVGVEQESSRLQVAVHGLVDDLLREDARLRVMVEPLESAG